MISEIRSFLHVSSKDSLLNDGGRVVASLDADISVTEVFSARNNMRTNSAPGLDQFSYEIIKALSQNKINILTEIYNLIYSEGKYPDSWHNVLVILISKQNGEGVQGPSPYYLVFSKFWRR